MTSVIPKDYTGGLHDLAQWAATIAQFLKPRGFFYIVDAPPMLRTIDELSDEPQSVRLVHSYFEHSDPLRFSEEGNYADCELPTTANVTYEWMHSLSEILMSLIGAGLTIELFGEHRLCPWKALPCCSQGPDTLFRLPDGLHHRVPLLFSLKARKPSWPPHRESKIRGFSKHPIW